MRIRTVKPEFFTHEGLFDLEARTKLPIRIAFAGLWCAADREGRFKWEPRRLGVAILPYDTIDFEKVLAALCDAGFIVRYGDDNKFVFIPGFQKHQCVNVREAKSALPEPEAEVERHHSQNLSAEISETVFARDGHKCVRCEASDDLTVDHIFPQVIGGTHALANLRTLCRPCNSARPIGGDGLVADLAKDGLSLGDMKRMCMHMTREIPARTREVHAHGEGKGKEGEGKGTGKDSAPPDGERESPEPRKESTGPHAEFGRRWTETYPDHHGGEKYVYQGGKDGTAIKALLSASKLNPAELEAVFVAAWKHPKGFYCKMAASICGLNSKFNEIREEIRTLGISAKPVTTFALTDPGPKGYDPMKDDEP